MKEQQDRPASTDAFASGPSSLGSSSADSARIAYYLRLSAVFRDRIARGEWLAGAQLPTLPELCERYGASRNTVRQALNLLIADGLVTSTRGKGTFVSDDVKHTHDLAGLPGLTGTQGTVSARETVQLLTRDRSAMLPAELAAAGEGVAGHRIAYVRILRMHTLDRKKFNLSDVYVAEQIYAKFPPGADEEERISELTRRHAKVKITRYRQQITIARADAEVAKLFGCPLGDVLVRIRRWLTDGNGDLIFASINAYRGDLFVLNRIDEDPEDLGYGPGLVPDISRGEVE